MESFILVNQAALERGAYVTYDLNHIDVNRDCILSGQHNSDSIYSECPSNVTMTINLLTAVNLNTFVVRLYSTDGRSYTFTTFDTSVDGQTWTEVLPANTVRSQTFTVTFPSRLVKFIRLRGTNTSNAYLHLIRFQAFNVPV